MLESPLSKRWIRCIKENEYWQSKSDSLPFLAYQNRDMSCT